MRYRLVGFIPFGRRLLHQQRDADRERAQELEARRELSPDGNARLVDFDGLGAEGQADRRRSDRGFADRSLGR